MRVFNGTVHMEFRTRFSIEKYENDIFSLFEASNEFIHVSCLSKIHFHQSGPFKLIKTMLKLGISPVSNLYPKGSHRHGLPSVQ